MTKPPNAKAAKPYSTRAQDTMVVGMLLVLAVIFVVGRIYG
jgi:hypothetical protein